MKVVEVKVNKVDFGNKMRAFVDVIFSLLDDGNGCVTLRGFRLFDGANGHFLSMPSEKVLIKNKESGEKEEKWMDRMFIDREVPEGKALLDEMTQAAVTKYNAQGAAEKAQSSTKKAETGTGAVGDEDIPW